MYPSGGGNSLLFIFLFKRGVVLSVSIPICFYFLSKNFLAVSYYHQPIIRLLWRGEDKRKMKQTRLLGGVASFCPRMKLSSWSFSRSSLFWYQISSLSFFDLRTCRFDFLFDEQISICSSIKSAPRLSLKPQTNQLLFSLSVWCASWVPSAQRVAVIHVEWCVSGARFVFPLQQI